MPETKVRRTAAQKRQEVEQEAEARRAAAEAVALTAWPARLMHNLQLACELGFKLEVKAGAFELRWPPGNWVCRLQMLPAGRFDYEWGSTGDWETMFQLERHLRDLELEREEALREEAIRQRAKSKLTDDEMRVLGLKR